ncbi:hypothetical protein [Frigoribacterium faeni]|uniref:Gram-positive cocci surface proteins LPxTG domain-containing protein n=1 Tax=Frigoribacterium faeni TaxID=145483 RepID=A0A7W3PJC2_9MICO|nr:hypothetical protein [Frigoribacterium faeni]MBA8813821.1 hypothetical protein [Frigoribacterium faeni]GEK82205.1 hypothetical protein FFA01_05140 [Frigoribacterium faeni]
MHTHTTWKKAAAIPTTLAIAVGGVLLVVPTATAATPDASVTEEARVADPTPAAVTEAPGEEPTEAVVSIEPVAEEAAHDEAPTDATDATDAVTTPPVADEPVAGEPAVDAPLAEAPVAEPAAEAPATEAPVADEPVAAEPVADAPVVETSAAGPVADGEQAVAAIPTAPVLTSPAAGAVVRSAARGESDFRAPVTFTGTGQPGAVVKVRLDPLHGWYSPTRYAVAPVAADGGWTATVELGDIVWVTTVRQYVAGADGQPTGDPSPELRTRLQHVVAYQAAPAPVSVVSPTVGAFYEPSSAQGATRLGGPVTIVVEGIPGAKAEMSWRDGEGRQAGPSGDITVPASGVLTHVATIPTGEWRFSARQYLVDDTGRRISSRSAVSGGRDFTVRPVTLAAPTLTSVADGGVLVADGRYPQDAIFGPRPAFVGDLVGTGTPGATIEIDARRGTTEGFGLSDAAVGADGTWRALAYLEPGEYVLTLRQKEEPVVSPSGTVGVTAGSPSITTRVSVVLPGSALDPAVGGGAAAGPGSTTVGTGGATVIGSGTNGSVAAGDADGSLAYTGAESAGPVGLIGALLVALGLGAVVVSRRRRALRGPAA